MNYFYFEVSISLGLQQNIFFFIMILMFFSK